MFSNSKKVKPLTEREQLQERSDYLKYFASKKLYLKFLRVGVSKAILKPRKGFCSKLLGNIKTQISNNIISL